MLNIRIQKSNETLHENKAEIEKLIILFHPIVPEDSLHELKTNVFIDKLQDEHLQPTPLCKTSKA